MKKLVLICSILMASVLAHAEAQVLYPMAVKDGGAYYITSLNHQETALLICRGLGYARLIGYDTFAPARVGAQHVAYAEFVKIPTGDFGYPVRRGPFTGWTLGPSGGVIRGVLRDSGISLGGGSSIGYYRDERIDFNAIKYVACDNKAGERNGFGKAIRLRNAF